MTRSRQQRPDELEQPLGHQQHERAGDERAIRPHVHEQPPHEPAIVALACLEILVAERAERAWRPWEGKLMRCERAVLVIG